MTKYHLNNLSCSLLLGFIFLGSCKGQNKTQPEGTVDDPKTIFTKQAKLVKTQGSTVYDNVHRGLLDKAGNLWFVTTGEGVYRYDGNSFIQFTVKDGLSSNTIWSILEDKKGNIWFGTADGVCRYNGKTFTSIPFSVTYGAYFSPNSSSNSVSSAKNAVWSIMQDRSGKIWFGTTNGVYCYDGVSFNRFLENENVINKNGLNLKVIESIVEDKNGDIWFGSSAGEGICRFDGKSLTNPAPNSKYGRIMFILEDKNGNLWFGTANHGAVRYNGKDFTSVMIQAGITTWVYSIFEDTNGNLWCATELGSGQIGEDGGVWRFDGKSFTRFTTKEGLIHNGVFCTVEDKVGNLWFGTRNTGLCRYDGKTFTKFSE